MHGGYARIAKAMRSDDGTPAQRPRRSPPSDARGTWNIVIDRPEAGGGPTPGNLKRVGVILVIGLAAPKQ